MHLASSHLITSHLILSDHQRRNENRSTPPSTTQPSAHPTVQKYKNPNTVNQPTYPHYHISNRSTHKKSQNTHAIPKPRTPIQISIHQRPPTPSPQKIPNPNSQIPNPNSNQSKTQKKSYHTISKSTKRHTDALTVLSHNSTKMRPQFQTPSLNTGKRPQNKIDNANPIFAIASSSFEGCCDMFICGM